MEPILIFLQHWSNLCIGLRTYSNSKTWVIKKLMMMVQLRFGVSDLQSRLQVENDIIIIIRTQAQQRWNVTNQSVLESKDKATTVKKSLSVTASWWLRSFYIPALLPETLIKVTAEHLAVKKLAAETQTESWPHLCKAFSPDQHCLLARQDLIVPVCSVPSLMYLLKMVELLKWLFIFSCFATEICQMLFFFSVYNKISL